MAGLSMRVAVDDRAVRRALGRLVRAGADLSPAMDEIGDALVTATQLRFERGETPEGAAWPPSRRVRDRAAAGGEAKTLIDSGRLLDSITHGFGPDFVEVGTNVIYAAIHQFGGQAGRGLAAAIPARPYLGVSAEDEAEILDTLGDFVGDAWGGVGAG